jgi:hypothetical protein
MEGLVRLQRQDMVVQLREEERLGEGVERLLEVLV